MAVSSKQHLAVLLRSLCSDAVFVIGSSRELVEHELALLSKRRAEHYSLVSKGAPADIENLNAWMVAMCAAIAPVHPPAWLPMNELVQSVSLEAGARGVRSLFTSKPSDREVHRARRIGALCVRSLGSILGSDGEFGSEEDLLRACLVAALGLPDDDARMLIAERPMPPEAIEVYGEMDLKVARALVRGAWKAAFCDGIDAREDEAVRTLARKLTIPTDELEAMREEARTGLDAGRAYAMACVDAVRYMLTDEGETGRWQARLTATVVLPPVYRPEALAGIESGAPVILAKRYSLERVEREACLALAWFSALSTDPSVARESELAARHDRVSADLGARPEGAVARAAVQSLVFEDLVTYAVSIGL